MAKGIESTIQCALSLPNKAVELTPYSLRFASVFGRSSPLAFGCEPSTNGGTRMDVIQEKHERAVGDAFMAWYNKRNGTTYAYHDRGANPPDLIYRSGSQQVLLEVTVAYYDAGHATMLWQNARGVPDAADVWSSQSPDAKLIDSINLMLAKKSTKLYPPSCILVLVLYPDLTTAEEFEELMPGVNVPAQHPFAEIYVGGMFPTSSSGSLGGYFWWRLSPTQQA